jgi:DNA-binding IclR family transcriptional regulator
MTGLPKSTVHRLLQAVVDRGFATPGSDGYLAVLRAADEVSAAPGWL